LKFLITNTKPTESLSRIQSQLYNNNYHHYLESGTGYEVYHFSVKMMLPGSWNALANDKDYGFNHGNFNIMQFFNNAGWLDGDPEGEVIDENHPKTKQPARIRNFCS
jgi:hypothetical protein